MMDRHNNGVAIRIGRAAATWDDVLTQARKIIEKSSGEGEDGSARWLEKRRWNELDGRWSDNWPNPDWSNVDEQSPLPSDPYTKSPQLQQKGATTPLDADDDLLVYVAALKPFGEWTETDARRVGKSIAFHDPDHPLHEQAADKVRRYRGTSSQAEGEVRVSAYERDGGDVQVKQHRRQKPAR